MFATPAEQRGSARRARRLLRTRRAGGVRRKLLALVLFLAFFIAVLPWLVTKTPLRDVLLSAALPSGIRVTVGDAALGWFSGLSLSQLELRNAAGETLLKADAIGVDCSLLQLLTNARELGTIEIARPTLHIKIRPDGSNLEDALTQILAEVGGPDAPDPAVDDANQHIAYVLELTEGTVVAEDVAMNRTWQVENVHVQYDTRGVHRGYGRGSFSAQVLDAGAGDAAAVPAGKISASLTPADGGRQQLSWEADGVALAMTEPWLRRFLVAAELSGTLSSQGTATWTASASPTDFTSSGALTISRLDATAPVLQGDRLRLVRAELPWRLAAGPAGVAIEDLQIQSEIGRAGLRGTIDAAALAGGASLTELISNSSARHDLEFRGALELAKLATMLPRALRVRPDTVISSGTVEGMGKCQPAAGGQLITASLRTSRLAATSAGRPFQWDQPVLANLRLAREGGAVRLDSLACDSEFLQVVASGTRQQFSASAQFDLNRLAQQLGQFIDLSQVELAGSGEAKVDWAQPGADAFSAQASGSLTQLRMALSGDGGAVWAEPQLEIKATAGGRLDPATQRPLQVDNGELRISALDDDLVARLTGPVKLSDAVPVWPASLQATGSVARWLTRVRPWFAPDPWQIDGMAELKTNLRVGGRSFEATGTALSVRDLRAKSADWNIDEPRVELAGDARWNGETGELAATSAQFVTSTVSLAAKDVHYRSSAVNGLASGNLSGGVAFRADLARLAKWRAEPADGAEYRPQGAVTGNVRFAQQNGRVVGELIANGENLALTQKSATAGMPSYEFIWQEPKVSAQGRLVYEAMTDQLAFQQLQIQSNTLQAAANGQVDQVSTAGNVQAAGTLNYDLAQVTPLLRPYLGNGIQLAGREQARFALAGHLTAPRTIAVQPASLSSESASRNPQSEISQHWSRRVRAQLEMPWSGANVYGLPVGPGKVAATLGDGAVRVEPLALAVGEGRLTAAPHVRLDPAPSELQLPAGPLMTNVRISPEVSEAMLKYVAPVLAGATQSEGLFSMELEGARVPLGEARRADSAGKLTVHSVRVVPGAMVREWIGLAQQVELLVRRRGTSPNPAPNRRGENVTLLSVRDQQVNFRVVEGRVHHQNMEFQVGDVVMRSQGSVGLDETLSLVLHVPIQDAWVADQPLLAGLKGQSLQVPISGTLTRPQMDPRAIAGLSQQLLQNAAGEAIGGEINKALDKLFKSK